MCEVAWWYDTMEVERLYGEDMYRLRPTHSSISWAIGLTVSRAIGDSSKLGHQLEIDIDSGM